MPPCARRASPPRSRCCRSCPTPRFRPRPGSASAWRVALVGVAALAVALLALAREVGELRLAVAPQAALSLDHEGPELGGRVALIERFERRAPLAVAVFTSPGCSLCAALEPSLRLLARDPEVELQLFDEHDDAEAWESLAVPGSPYAVVLAPDGEVLSQGHLQLALPAGIAARPGGGACLASAVAGATSRRGFLARTGQVRCSASPAAASCSDAIRAQKAEAFHFCGHIYTTGSCPHPTGLPRIDANGFPLRAVDGEPVDDLGRPVDKLGRPVDAHGKLLRDPDGNPLPPAPRTRVCASRPRVRLPRPDRRRLVPLLQRPHPQARRLLRLHDVPDQRRLRADRLLLQRPARVLRHVLRHEDRVLTPALVLTALLVGLAGAWSP